MEEIINKMTLEEKVSQLCSVYITDLIENGEISEKLLEKELKFGIGEVSRVYGRIKNLEPEKAKEYVEKIQKFLKEKTRLGIPAIIHEECLSGFMTNKATSFPQIIGLASTFNPDIVKKMTEIIRRQMRNAGVHQGLSPVLDICYDPRWGRTEETFGEDPYLCAIMGLNYVKGLQGENLKDGIVATGKHFASYSFSEGGRNLCSVHVGERELRDIFLFPFEVCVKEGKLKSIMNAYHDIDGIPCVCSRKLFKEILRKEWGFDGIVVSDYSSIKMLNTFHSVAKDDKECAILSLTAGIDIELPRRECYPLLIECVKEKIIDEKVIDEAVKRVLKLKKELGLFEEKRRYFIDFDRKEDRELAYEIAKESFVLLKNDGILPLKNIKSISFIGPSVDCARNYFGDYAYTAHLDLKTPSVECKTILEVFKERAKDIEIFYEKGCEIFDFKKDNFENAIKTAEKGDVIIFVGGDRSGFSPECTCGEGKDSHNLKLPGLQEELILKLSEIKKPLILILITGRPYILTEISERVNAIVECWFPGEETGNAIFDLLFGKFSPSGRLPISFPKSVGQIPVFYHRKHTDRNYVYSNSKPLYCFGYGLSYTKFEYSDFKLEPKEVRANGKFKVYVSVKNTGDMEGSEVVQLYIKKKFSSIVPSKLLKGFCKLNLRVNEMKKIEFEVPTEILSFRDENLKIKIEEGIYEVMIGRSSEDIIFKDEVRITGSKILRKRRNFFSKIIIK